MSTAEEHHQKLLSFLAEQVNRSDKHVVTSVELDFSPGRGSRDENLREWPRHEYAELYELANLNNFTAMILSIAEDDADSREPGKHNYIVRTRHHMGLRQVCRFWMQPASRGNADDGMMALSAAGGAARPDAVASVLAGHANRLMNINATMFDGSVRVLGKLVEGLTKENSDLRTENLTLRREIEEARSNRTEREFEMSLALNKDRRANESLNKLFQIAAVIAAKFTSSGAAGVVGEQSPLATLVGQFAKSLKPNQMQTMFAQLDTEQQIMFGQIMDMVIKSQQVSSQPPPPS